MSLQASATSLYRRVVDGLRRTIRRHWGARPSGADESTGACSEDRDDAVPVEDCSDAEGTEGRNHPIDGDHPGHFIRTGVEL